MLLPERQEFSNLLGGNKLLQSLPRKWATVHWKQTVQINTMKADIFGDDFESFPLDNIKSIKLGLACIHIRLPQSLSTLYSF